MAEMSEPVVSAPVFYWRLGAKDANGSEAKELFVYDQLATINMQESALSIGLELCDYRRYKTGCPWESAVGARSANHMLL